MSAGNGRVGVRVAGTPGLVGILLLPLLLLVAGCSSQAPVPAIGKNPASVRAAAHAGWDAVDWQQRLADCADDQEFGRLADTMIESTPPPVAVSILKESLRPGVTKRRRASVGVRIGQLVAVTESALPILIQLLDDEDSLVASHASEHLVLYLEARDDVEMALVRSLERTAHVSQALIIIDALGSLMHPSPAAEEALLGVISNKQRWTPEVRSQAALALGRYLRGPRHSR